MRPQNYSQNATPARTHATFWRAACTLHVLIAQRQRAPRRGGARARSTRPQIYSVNATLARAHRHFGARRARRVRSRACALHVLIAPRQRAPRRDRARARSMRPKNYSHNATPARTRATFWRAARAAFPLARVCSLHVWVECARAPRGRICTATTPHSRATTDMLARGVSAHARVHYTY